MPSKTSDVSTAIVIVAVVVLAGACFAWCYYPDHRSAILQAVIGYP